MMALIRLVLLGFGLLAVLGVRAESVSSLMNMSCAVISEGVQTPMSEGARDYIWEDNGLIVLVEPRGDLTSARITFLDPALSSEAKAVVVNGDMYKLDAKARLNMKATLLSFSTQILAPLRNGTITVSHAIYGQQLRILCLPK